MWRAKNSEAWHGSLCHSLNYSSGEPYLSYRYFQRFTPSFALENFASLSHLILWLILPLPFMSIFSPMHLFYFTLSFQSLFHWSNSHPHSSWLVYQLEIYETHIFFGLKIVGYLIFSFWLISLFIIGSRFIHLTATDSNSFLFMTE